uniref:Putative hipothetical protein n=1 Tax=Amblyomma aureolatum TaxID=187763 RepID=A0A1E1WWN2_9ACAR
MSTQPGNTSRTRGQKHQNATAFKNTLHDTSIHTKRILNTKTDNLCVRCKDIIEWKIKYKKYKPLTVPRKCVKCEGKTVKAAYHIMCSTCAQRLEVCAKCGDSEGSESSSQVTG